MVPLSSPVSSMMTRSQKMQAISRKWKDIAKLGQLVPTTMRSGDDDYWKAEDSSLEHQVTITILSTVTSNETENAHFLVSPQHGGASDGTAASILSDLASQEQLLNNPRVSRSRRRLSSTSKRQTKNNNASPTNLQEGTTKEPRSSLDDDPGMANKSVPLTADKEDDRIRTKLSTRTIQFVDSFDPLELNEEPLPEFALIDSFDSLSWGPCEDKGTTTTDYSESLPINPGDKVPTKTEIDRNGFPKLAD